jgi:hypothetical protein
LFDQCAEARGDRLGVGGDRDDGRLVDDRRPDRVGVAKRHLQRDAATRACADHHGRPVAERGKQPGRVVGLLGDRGRCPARGPRAAGVAAPVIGGDGELIGERGGHPGELGGVAAGAGDQQYRRAVAAGLGVQHSVVGLHPLDVHEGARRRLVAGRQAPAGAGGHHPGRR